MGAAVAGVAVAERPAGVDPLPLTEEPPTQWLHLPLFAEAGGEDSLLVLGRRYHRQL